MSITTTVPSKFVAQDLKQRDRDKTLLSHTDLNFFYSSLSLLVAAAADDHRT